MMTSVRLYLLAVSNAVSPCCDGHGEGWGGVEAAAPGGELRAGRRGEAARRLRTGPLPPSRVPFKNTPLVTWLTLPQPQPGPA